MNGSTSMVTSFPAWATRATACLARNRGRRSIAAHRPAPLDLERTGVRVSELLRVLLAAPALLAEAHLLRQGRARLRVGRSDHGVIGRKTPLLPIFFGG